MYHRDVLARLDHLVEVADAALAHGARERSVHPACFATLQQVATGQIGGGEVVMAGHRIQWLAQACGHVLHEAGLAASGRTLDEQRQALLEGVFEQPAFVADRRVERWFVCPLGLAGGVGDVHACLPENAGARGSGVTAHFPPLIAADSAFM